MDVGLEDGLLVLHIAAAQFWTPLGFHRLPAPKSVSHPNPLQIVAQMENVPVDSDKAPDHVPRSYQVVVEKVQYGQEGDGPIYYYLSNRCTFSLNSAYVRGYWMDANWGHIGI